MKYTILQLDIDNLNVLRDHKLFESWDILNKTAGFNIHQYKKVYEGDVDETAGKEQQISVLDYLFMKFNLNHPDDFKGHSLSVSDVVILDGVKYYCDNYGWVNIETGKEI